MCHRYKGAIFFPPESFLSPITVLLILQQKIENDMHTKDYYYLICEK